MNSVRDSGQRIVLRCWSFSKCVDPIAVDALPIACMLINLKVCGTLQMSVHSHCLYPVTTTGRPPNNNGPGTLLRRLSISQNIKHHELWGAFRRTRRTHCHGVTNRGPSMYYYTSELPPLRRLMWDAFTTISACEWRVPANYGGHMTKQWER